MDASTDKETVFCLETILFQTSPRVSVGTMPILRPLLSTRLGIETEAGLMFSVSAAVQTPGMRPEESG